MGEQPDSGEDAGTTEAGGNVQGSVETANYSNHAEETTQGAETVAGESPVADDAVYGSHEEYRVDDNDVAGGTRVGVGRWTLSDMRAQNGEQFYQDADGNIDLVDIPQEVFDEIGYTKAPLRLTPSMLKHVQIQHGKETNITNDQEAIMFITDVMKNFDHVRFGNNGALIFSVENGRQKTGKRAITILLNSDNGEFYGIKTSGYESVERLSKRPLLWEGSAIITPSTDTATEPVTSRDAQQGGEQSGSASGQSGLSEGKNTNNSPNNQENLGKTSSPDEIAAEEAKVDTNPTEAQKEAGLDNGKDSRDSNENMLNNDDVISDIDENDVPLQKRSSKSYTDREGVYHEGLEEELEHIEESIRSRLASDTAAGDNGLSSAEVPDMVPVEASAGMAEGTDTRNREIQQRQPTVAELRRRASVIRTEQARLAGESINSAENYSNIINEGAESEDNDVSLPKGWESLPTNDIENEKKGWHIKGLKTLLDENYKELIKALTGNGSRTDGSVSLKRARAALRRELDERDRRYREWQDKYNIDKEGRISLEDLSRLFHDHNKSKILGKLFDKVAEVAKPLGLEILFDNNLDAGGASNYNGRVRYNTGLLTSSGYNWHDISRTVLHELIHSVTQSTVSAYKRGGEYADNLTDSQRKAAQQIIDIHKELKEWADNNGYGETYGFGTPHEMLAEMASLNFRNILKAIKTKEKKSVWEILKDAMHGIFSLTKETDAEKRVTKALDDLIDNFSMDTFESMRDYEGGEEWSQPKEIERTLMGVHNISEEKLKKALKQGGLANPSMAVIDTRNYTHTDYGDISLIPKSDMIDSKTGRNAGTFTADAWTPTYPQL